MQGSDVLDDNALQWLSVTCPSGMFISLFGPKALNILYPSADYHSFKRELANSMEMDDTDQLVNEKWKAYGQQFLELCIHHKAVAESVSPAVLFCSDLIPTTL